MSNEDRIQALLNSQAVERGETVETVEFGGEGYTIHSGGAVGKVINPKGVMVIAIGARPTRGEMFAFAGGYHGGFRDGQKAAKTVTTGLPASMPDNLGVRVKLALFRTAEHRLGHNLPKSPAEWAAFHMQNAALVDLAQRLLTEGAGDI